MRLLVSWVRDFVNVTAPAAEIADTLALRGFEVASIEPVGDDDAVIDFEVTANRPDCLSVLGFAREIATAYGLPIRLPSADAGAAIALAPLSVGTSDRLRVSIEDPERCPRYSAAVAEATPATSPDWMTSRLQAAGVRPISPIVDITNYVLMELGHPMHAFDLATLDGAEIRVRCATPGEVVTTLDGVTRKLEPDMLVIADGRRAQAVAGVMGGAASEVTPSTRIVAFESAHFQPASVRRTSKRLGLKTEASSRFERGADINAPVVALQRCLALLGQLGAGRPIGPIVDEYPAHRGPRTLHLRRDRLARLLGLDVPDADVVRILQGLGFETTAGTGGWQVRVPTFRVDVLREVDLIEEVGRHYGLDKLEPAFPPVTVAAPAPDARVTRDRLARRVLTSAGLSEAITFGFIEAEAAQAFAPGGDQGQLVAVANPLSAKFAVLRPSLIAGLLSAVAHNRRHGRRDVALFEIGSRVTAVTGETRGVAIAWTGASGAEHWSAATREVDFFDLKGTVETLCDALGAKVELEAAAVPYLVAGQTAGIKLGDTTIGLAGLLSPSLVDRAGAPRQDKVFVAELDLDAIAALTTQTSGPGADEMRVTALPRYPFIVRDLSIVVSASLPASIIRGTIQAAGDVAGAPIVSIAFFDRYQGKGVPDGSVSVSVRITFQAADRTLTDAEVQHAFDKIISALVREHGATQR